MLPEKIFHGRADFAPGGDPHPAPSRRQYTSPGIRGNPEFRAHARHCAAAHGMEPSAIGPPAPTPILQPGRANPSSPPLTRTNDRAINAHMTKGIDTRMTILETGLDLASRLGLEAVTIGTLAKATGMSKSGLFAHFQSKENLQIELLKFAGEIFAKDVVAPALRIASGEPRIRALVVNWIKYARNLAGGCIFVTASTDFKDRPGKVRDFIISQQESWIDCLRRVARSAVESGDFRDDIDCDQFAFEIYSLLLGFHLYHTLLDSAETEKRQEAALDQLLRVYRHPVAEGTSKRRETGLPT